MKCLLCCETSKPSVIFCRYGSYLLLSETLIFKSICESGKNSSHNIYRRNQFKYTPFVIRTDRDGLYVRKTLEHSFQMRCGTAQRDVGSGCVWVLKTKPTVGFFQWAALVPEIWCDKKIGFPLQPSGLYWTSKGFGCMFSYKRRHCLPWQPLERLCRPLHFCISDEKRPPACIRSYLQSGFCKTNKIKNKLYIWSDAFHIWYITAWNLCIYFKWCVISTVWNRWKVTCFFFERIVYPINNRQIPNPQSGGPQAPFLICEKSKV